MKLVSLYDFDPSGTLGANKVVNESITIVPPGNIRDVSFFCPRAAPFFANSMVIKTGTGIGARTLIEDVDYRIVFDFVSASVHLKRRINVGIALLNPEYSGTLYLTYQALGGEYSLADFSVFEEILRERYSTVHVAYEQIVNLPPGFATAWHEHVVHDMVGMRDVVTELVGIKEAILAKPGSWSQINKMLEDHLTTNNAHSPRQVGLGNVMNYGVATQQDIDAGRTDKYITANMVKHILSGVSIDTSNLATTTALTNAINDVKKQINTKVETGIANGNFATKVDITTLTNTLNEYLRKDDMTAIQTHLEVLPDHVTAGTSVNLVDILNGTNLQNRKKIASGRSIIRVTKNGSDAFNLNVGNYLYTDNGQNVWKEGCQITVFNNSSTANMIVRIGTYSRTVEPQHAVSLIKINGEIEIAGGGQAPAPVVNNISNGLSSQEVTNMISQAVTQVKNEVTQAVNEMKSTVNGLSSSGKLPAYAIIEVSVAQRTDSILHINIPSIHLNTDTFNVSGNKIMMPNWFNLNDYYFVCHTYTTNRVYGIYNESDRAIHVNSSYDGTRERVDRLRVEVYKRR